MKCTPPFSLQGFPTFLVTYPHTVVLETLIDIVKFNFFFNLSVLWNYFAHTYSFFDNTSLTVCEKNSLPLLGFSSNIFTFDHLFSHRLVVFNNLAIFVKTKWPEDHKNRYRSFSTNSVGLQFQIKIKKIKENGKNKKIENLQNGQKKNGGKIPANVYIWGKIEYFSLKLL